MPGDLDPHWLWLAGGLLLAAAEIFVPGLFLIWLAVAALITGLVTFAYPLDPAMQVLVFAALALVSVLLARRWLRYGRVQGGADPLLNNLGGRLIGETVVVTQAISGGSGRVRQGDGEWPARGANAAAGTRMRVVDRDGLFLIVEPLETGEG